MTDPELEVRVDAELPARLPAGSATSVFVLGTCFHRRSPIDRLELLAGEDAVDAMEHSMPRIDVYTDLHPPSVWDPDTAPDPGAERGYRSGFWGIVPVAMPEEGAVELALRATLEDGGVSIAPLASIAVTEPAVTAPKPDRVPAIAICMATYEPDPELLRVQLDSIRAQTREDWICLISDDASSLERFAELERAVEGDPRFVVSRSPSRLGFYRNFERALEMVPPEVELVALSDQDDRWYPEKLAVLADALGDSQLVYSDQRLVDTDGTVHADSYWAGARSNNHGNLTSLLIANTVTGAASLFRRDLLDAALPFPRPPGAQYHDHWLALVALVSGGIAYVDRPLYDYVQHGAAAVGYEGSNLGLLPGRRRRRGPLGALKRIATGSRASYFFALCRLRVLAETLLLRSGDEMGGASRRALRRFIAVDHSLPAFLALSARRLRRRFGRTETMGAERIIQIAVLWVHAVALIGRLRDRPLPGQTWDAIMPPGPPDSGGGAEAPIEHVRTRQLAEATRPLPLVVSADEPERVNLLVPTIDLAHFFGGYLGKFNLARRLAERGMRVRIVTVDPTPPLPGSWREQVEGYAGLDGLFDRVEVAFAREEPLRVSPDDAFVATTWWTALVAGDAVRPLRRTRFLYLIQEFEPFTHPMGSMAAAAMSTYSLPHTALFSTELLRRYFAERGYGVYASGARQGKRDSAAFENAITRAEPPSIEQMRARERRRLLFYARPEGHGSRNMFELGLLALRDAVAAGAIDESWDLYGIGSVGGTDRRISLPGGRHLDLLAKRGQSDYGELLAAHDVGLSLMYTPHPSLVPIEMASAGLVTVTNSFETKTAAEMEAISPNLATVEATPRALAAGIEEAVGRSGDFEARREGSAVRWSRDWDETFDEKLIERIAALIEAT